MRSKIVSRGCKRRPWALLRCLKVHLERHLAPHAGLPGPTREITGHPTRPSGGPRGPWSALGLPKGIQEGSKNRPWGRSRNRFKKRSLFGGLWRVKIELSPRRNTHFYKPLERQRASKKRTKMNRKIDTGPAEFNSTRRAGSSGSWRSS